MKQKVSFFILFLILILGFFLRVVNLEKVPNGFFCDEAANGYNAYKILTTGKDEHGVPYPFFFRSFGDYRNPVVVYLMIPSIAIFGLSEFSVRLTSAIFGVLTIIAIYFLTKKILEPRTWSLEPATAALLLAISPWHIHFSRTGFEFIYFPFFFTIALYLFFLGLKKKFWLPLSFLFFGITFYTYYPTQIQTPLFLFGFLLIFGKLLFTKGRVRNTILSLIIFFICLVPFLIGVKKGIVLTRFESVSIFKEVKDVKQVAKFIITSYRDHFSLTFLFKKGDIDFPGHFITRHSVRGMGQLYLWQLPVMIAGTFFLIKDFLIKRLSAGEKKLVLVLILWFLIYPLGSIFTPDAPYAHRSIIGVIPFQILSALGFSFLLNLAIKLTSVRRSDRRLQATSSLDLRNLKSRIVSRRIVLLGLISLLVLGAGEFLRYLNLYFNQYPQYSSDYWGWQFGPREIIEYFKTQKHDYDELYMTGRFNAPHIFLKFYDPKGECINCFIGGVDRLDPNKKQLFALRAEELGRVEGADFEIKKVIRYPNEKEAFFIGEVK